MARLIVSATGSPLFNDFLMLVSVSSSNGAPKKALKASNFKIHHLASLNHASVKARPVVKATEGPDGFYTLRLKPDDVQPSLPPGHYVLAVAVTSGPNHGQTVAVGDIPS